MTEKYKTLDDLKARHSEYLLGAFDESGMQTMEGDLHSLCHVAGVSATGEDRRHVGFSNFLINARGFNLEALPQEPLNIGRLSAFVGMGEEYMEKFFGQDVDKAYEAVKNGETLDLNAPETRDEVIERVLQDTRYLIKPLSVWFAMEENHSTGHFLGHDTLIQNLVTPGNPYFQRPVMGGAKLHAKINIVLTSLGLEALPPMEQKQKVYPTPPGFFKGGMAP